MTLSVGLWPPAHALSRAADATNNAVWGSSLIGDQPAKLLSKDEARRIAANIAKRGPAPKPGPHFQTKATTRAAAATMPKPVRRGTNSCGIVIIMGFK
jgi:hypothetical protein